MHEMKRLSFLAVVSFLTAFTFFLKIDQDEYDIEDMLKFEAWRRKHRVEFYNIKEKQYRMKIFFDNIHHIKNINKLAKNYKLKCNKFAHMTIVEFVQKYAVKKIKHQRGKLEYQIPQTKAPIYKDSINWVELGAVTRIKSQSNDCRASWAFSAVETLESAYYLFSGKLQELSPQSIIDCSSSYGNGGCNTGRTDFTLNYIVDEGAIDISQYPIGTRQERCKVNIGMKKFRAVGYSTVFKGEKNLQETVQKRPVSVSINARPLIFYSSGVYDDYEKCPEEEEGNTGMVVVGFGEEDGVKYWLLKNSWGEEWGEKGYLRLKRKEDMGIGICGLTLNALYPFVRFR